jgi:hypothetical protein
MRLVTRYFLFFSSPHSESGDSSAKSKIALIHLKKSKRNQITERGKKTMTCDGFEDYDYYLRIEGVQQFGVGADLRRDRKGISLTLFAGAHNKELGKKIEGILVGNGWKSSGLSENFDGEFDSVEEAIKSIEKLGIIAKKT